MLQTATCLRALAGRAARRGPAGPSASHPPLWRDERGLLHPQPPQQAPLPLLPCSAARALPARRGWAGLAGASFAAAALLSAAACRDDEEEEDEDGGQDEAEGDAGAAGQSDAQARAAEERRRSRTSKAIAGQKSDKTQQKYRPFVTAWQVRRGRALLTRIRLPALTGRAARPGLVQRGRLEWHRHTRRRRGFLAGVVGGAREDHLYKNKGAHSTSRATRALARRSTAPHMTAASRPCRLDQI